MMLQYVCIVSNVFSLLFEAFEHFCLFVKAFQLSFISRHIFPRVFVGGSMSWIMSPWFTRGGKRDGESYQRTSCFKTSPYPTALRNAVTASIKTLSGASRTFIFTRRPQMGVQDAKRQLKSRKFHNLDSVFALSHGCKIIWRSVPEHPSASTI